MLLDLSRYKPITFGDISKQSYEPVVEFYPYQFDDNPYVRMIDSVDTDDEIPMDAPVAKTATWVNLPIPEEPENKKVDKDAGRRSGRRVARNRIPYKGKEAWKSELREAYKEAGVSNKDMLDILVSQDGLESAWGRSASGKYNYGNITTGSSWKGDYVVSGDKDANGNSIRQKFRSYESMAQYAKDKWSLLKRLYNVDENDDINAFASKLTSGRLKYAEDPQYAAKLISVYNSNRS